MTLPAQPVHHNPQTHHPIGQPGQPLQHQNQFPFPHPIHPHHQPHPQQQINPHHPQQIIRQPLLNQSMLYNQAPLQQHNFVSNRRGNPGNHGYNGNHGNIHRTFLPSVGNGNHRTFPPGNGLLSNKNIRDPRKSSKS